MLSKAALLPIGLALAVAPLAGNAAGVDFQLRLEAGVQYYRFIQDGLRFEAEQFVPELNVTATTVVDSEKLEFSSTQALFGAGLTAFVGDFFVDLSGIGTIENSDTTDQDIAITTQVPGPDGAPINVSEQRARAKHDSEGRQEDYAISFGYSVNDRFVVYAGYKWGEVSSSDTVDLSPIVPLETVTLEVDFDFDRRGPFIGVAYGWPITRGALDGVLSFNAAAAFLAGDLDFQADSTPQDGMDNAMPISNLVNVNSEGDTVGLTLGLTWTGSTSADGLTYSLGLNGYSYDYNADTQQGVSADFREQAVSFELGLNYLF